MALRSQLRRAWAFARAFFTNQPTFLHTRTGETYLPPIAGGADDPDDDKDKKKDDPDAKDDPAKDDPDDDKDKKKDDPDDKVQPDDDWKSKSRKNESRAKRAEREAEDLRKKLKEREDADKSEQEKALEAAREEGEKKARESADTERRHDRLEVAVTRAAAKGVKVGEGEDAKTQRFDDPEDALVFLERRISNGELDEDDIFDEKGRVKPDALEEALVELLNSKPRLAAGAEGRKPGDPDTRKGDEVSGDLESMSVEDHAKAIRRHK
jgi:hypothetical protein